MRIRSQSTCLLILAWVLAGCSSSPFSKPCDDIPYGGCPLSRGGTCDDPECSALYACNDGAWSLDQVCAAAEVGGGGGAGGAGSGGDQGGCHGVAIDATGEAPNCTPDLQLPDCPASAAEACEPCLTGCVDFFVCTSDGWDARAYCGEDGEVVVDP